MYHRLLSAGWDYRCEPPHPASDCVSNVSLYPLPVNGRSGGLIRCEQVGCVFRGSGCSLPPRRHGMPAPHLRHPPSRRDRRLATFRVIGTGSTETVSGFGCRCCRFGMVVEGQRGHCSLLRDPAGQAARDCRTARGKLGGGGQGWLWRERKQPPGAWWKLREHEEVSCSL